MKKSQVFSASILIISVLTLIIVFEYNQFYLNSKSKLSDYLIIDEMSETAHNHFETLSRIIGNHIYIENYQDYSLINFESYINSDYNASSTFSKYSSLASGNKKGIATNYSYQGIENDILSGISTRNITSIDLSITHNFNTDLIVFENISSINPLNLNLLFNGALIAFSFCPQNSSGKTINIIGPNGYNYDSTVSNNCEINLILTNFSDFDLMQVNFNVLSNDLTINYAGINELTDVNIKIMANSSYDNLFKISSNYNNTRIVLSKGSYLLNKSLD